MRRIRERQQRSGEVIQAAALRQIQLDSRAQRICPSADIVPQETSHGTALLISSAFREELGGGGSGALLGKVQSDFSDSGTTVSVKTCDAAGTESGSAFNVYLKPDQSAFDPTAVTVANTAATATCKLAAGKIIGYAYSGADAYMLGDVAQVLKDWWVDGTTGKVVYAVYWRVGIAVSTVSNVEGPDTEESQTTPCTQPGS